MGYTKKPASVLRAKKYLEILADREHNVQFFTSNPDRLAYLLRQALHVIPLFKRFEYWNHLPFKWTISTRLDSVLARYEEGAEVIEPNPASLIDRRRANPTTDDIPHPQNIEAFDGDDSSLQPINPREEEESQSEVFSISAKEVQGQKTSTLIEEEHESSLEEFRAQHSVTLDIPLTSAAGVIGAVLKHKKEAAEIYLPNAQVSFENLVKIWKWTQAPSSEGEWFIIEHVGEGITLTQKEIPEELKWTPEGD
jgi:hypothetical protein